MSTVTVGLGDIVTLKHSPDNMLWEIETMPLDGSRWVDLKGVSVGNQDERMYDVPLDDITL